MVTSCSTDRLQFHGDDLLDRLLGWGITPLYDVKTLRLGTASPSRPQRILELLLRCSHEVALALPQSRASIWSGGYPALQDRLEVKPPLHYLFNSMSLTLVCCMPCIITIVSISDKWGYAHASVHWQSPEFIAIIRCQ